LRPELADETTDISSGTIFGLCVLCMDDSEVKACEQLLLFVPVSNACGQELGDTPVES
jgi:hypothetical protein